jgi:hypothetical protein
LANEGHIPYHRRDRQLVQLWGVCSSNSDGASTTALERRGIRGTVGLPISGAREIVSRLLKSRSRMGEQLEFSDRPHSDPLHQQ